MLQALILAVLLIVVSIAVVMNTRRRKGLPPGPISFPILGYLPFVDRQTPTNTVEQLRQKYGDVFLVKIGSRDVVYISDYDIAKEVFAHNDFHGRPDFHTFLTIYNGKLRGITGTSGKLWEEQRRFVIRQLRDFGFGKSSLEDIILAETEGVVESFRKHDGKPFSITYAFNGAISNITWSLIAGERIFDFKHSEKLIEGIERSADSAQSSLLDYLPWMKAFVSTKGAGTEAIQSKNKLSIPYFMDLIKRHEDTYIEGSPRDLIDSYLARIYEDEQKGVTDSTFTREQLLGVLNDLLAASSNTLPNFLVFSFLLLVYFPEIQEKIHKDIEREIGYSRTISVSDMNKLPYLQAYLMEVQRYIALTPLGAPHCTTKDTKIQNYHIPKNTVVHVNFGHIHQDPRYWEKPDEFKPERFLNEDGSVMFKPKGFLPFSTGRRSCPGESFTKMETFLFVGRMLQQLRFSLPADAPRPSSKAKRQGLFSHPDAFQMIATPVQ